MSPGGIAPTLDELEDRDADLSLCQELTPVEQFAFQRREKALAHGVVIGITD